MNQNELLHTMCHDVLSNADVKAISQNRGFSTAEAGTRALFESFFLAEIGVAEVIQSLSRNEIILLHLLHSRHNLVDIAFFARAYPMETRSYGTFTQLYQPVFQAVRDNLVRRGLLIMAESGNGDTKMERWRFQFPQQFAHLLPPMLEAPATFAAHGVVQYENIRTKIMTLLKPKRFGLYVANVEKYAMTIVDGDLRMGEGCFALSTLLKFQAECWAAALPKSENSYIVRNKITNLSPVDAARYALAQLPTDGWLTPPQLGSILEIFCDQPKIDPFKLCEVGWEWGCVARHTIDGTAHYRLSSADAERGKRRLGAALTIEEARINVDLARIDYGDLEQLAQIADWRVAQQQLIAHPNLVKIGNLSPTAREHPLLQWLEENAPVYAQAVRTVNRRWGKEIVHENLLVAKVNDLSLKVALEKAVGNSNNFLLLPNDFIAFPRGLLPTVEKIVKQAGQVIKRVQPDE